MISLKELAFRIGQQMLIDYETTRIAEHVSYNRIFRETELVNHVYEAFSIGLVRPILQERCFVCGCEIYGVIAHLRVDLLVFSYVVV